MNTMKFETQLAAGCNRVFSVAMAVILAALFFAEAAVADITILERESRGRLRVFAGSGGAVDLDDVDDLNENPTGIFAFNAEFDNLVTEDDPFSTGAAHAFGAISITDNVIQTVADCLTVVTQRTSAANVQYLSGNGIANSGPRHTFRVRFRVEDVPVRYSINGVFAPGPLMNGETLLILQRPFTTNTFFEYDSFQELDETGILPPGQTYEIRVKVNDLLSAVASNPGPESESTSYNFEFNVKNALLGDVNMDGSINLLDVDAFIEALSSGNYIFEADMNQDEMVNLLDVDLFIDAIAGN